MLSSSSAVPPVTAWHVHTYRGIKNNPNDGTMATMPMGMMMDEDYNDPWRQAMTTMITGLMYGDQALIR